MLKTGRALQSKSVLCREATCLLAVFSLLVLLVLLSGCGGGTGGGNSGEEITLLNVSYDPTRELYREFNEAFAKYWREKTGQSVKIDQSHGGSGSQSRAVIDGLAADVVTLALAFDVDAIAEHGGLLPADWQGRLPHNSAPYASTLAFLVRKGNPKNIHTWEDLAREGVQVITPNPKTSGVARWNYLAMWGHALRRELGDDWVAKVNDPAHAEKVASAHQAAQKFVAAVYRNVPVLDRGARGATNTFIQRRIGDVLINWENEALLGAGELDAAGVELVVPPVSILAEPVVALVDKNVDRKGTRGVAQAYLEYLYSEVGQDLAGKNYYRPIASETAQAKYRDQFPQLELFTINDVFGGWAAASALHFADGGTFDQIYQPR
ncbi:MAG: sulfate ABC transporter substrate-binding protein [Thermoguttaceae bacterium]|jgi:sulfate transport system substrate-binding protein|nr:sulfate ABC transporter substrate-binding protein [Thermoguttaceae bacterium]